jgi:hypothetical protein
MVTSLSTLGRNSVVVVEAEVAVEEVVVEE